MGEWNSGLVLFVRQKQVQIKYWNSKNVTPCNLSCNCISEIWNVYTETYFALVVLGDALCVQQISFPCLFWVTHLYFQDWTYKTLNVRVIFGYISGSVACGMPLVGGVQQHIFVVMKIHTTIFRNAVSTQGKILTLPQ